MSRVNVELKKLKVTFALGKKNYIEIYYQLAFRIKISKHKSNYFKMNFANVHSDIRSVFLF